VQPLVNIEYTASDATFPNPERGLYHYIETRASNPEAYDLPTLRGYRQHGGVTLLYCITYLEPFVEQPISEDFLAHVRGNLATVREAGLKCILRFAYTDDDPTRRDEEPPFGDATRERILAHLAQLKPILAEYGDVIALMQAGFIGVWGEWYYTDWFVDEPADPSTISPAQYARRREVLDAILDALPANRMTAVRYPFGKQEMLASSTPLNPATAFQATTAARTGFHNDCFLVDNTDSGTYREGQIAADKAYLAAETLYVLMGGETCGPNPPRSQCPTALAEMARFHWSYANWDYHPSVIMEWVDGGCMQEIEQRLGYRFVLTRGTYPTAVRPGDGLSLHIELENQGFAPLYNPRPVRPVLRHRATGSLYAATLALDPRLWQPGDAVVIDATIGILPQMPQGDYELLLHMPDESPALAARPEYAVQFANTGVWESATGLNNLLATIAITPSAPPHPFAGDLFFTRPGLATTFLPVLLH
jgi:hypothetical protein